MRINDQTLNRLAVLKAIRQHGPIARSDLPRLTELSAGTITQLTAELLRRGLILERKDSTKRNGRPRTFLEIARNGAVVVGASIEGQGLLTTAFVDLMGNLLFAPVMDAIGARWVLLGGAVWAVVLAWYCNIERLDRLAEQQGASNHLEPDHTATFDEHGISAGD